MSAPEVDYPSIVFIGQFNPAIFQPMWFAHYGLVREDEAVAANIENVHPQLTAFELGWVRIQVTTNRFTAIASDSGHLAPLRDLVLGSFGLLEHTPISAVGLNRQTHYKATGEDEWHALGDYLAPKQFWQSEFGGRPGMRSLAIESQRPGSESKYIVRVEPSVKVQHGFAFDTNEHFQIHTKTRQDEAIPPGTAPKALAVVSGNWDAAMQFSLNLGSNLLAQLRKRP